MKSLPRLLLAVVFCGPAALIHASPEDATIGINILLDRAPGEAILTDLEKHGRVLDVMPEINGVTLRAKASELRAIQALSYVKGASPDAECFLLGDVGPSVPDFAGGASHWCLDAINVTDAGGGRTVAYDGEGVYVAVIDSGLPRNWRAYFPEERIDVTHARAFGGGGGEAGTVSDQPEKWEHDTKEHGGAVTSIILGFNYTGPMSLPATFNGVAPKTTVIPVRTFDGNKGAWHSVNTRAILYVTGLKVSGALGDAPLVINMSFGGQGADVLQAAAIDYAIANGVVVVAAAGNDGDDGMIFPGRHAPAISVAASGWVNQWTSDDQSRIEWIFDDIPEDDASQHFIWFFSSRALAGEDLDVSAPGGMVPVPLTVNGKVEYSWFDGTSAASPCVAGVVALMLQKNPGLTQAEIEEILEATALPLPAGCRDLLAPGLGPGDYPTWGDDGNVFYFGTTFCWDSDATGHGLVDAAAALAATPSP
jgi:subtilisin family serine protease